MQLEPGGLAYRDDPGGPGVLIDSGSIVNTGSIALGGGQASFYANDYGATAAITGTLDNFSVITIGAAQLQYYSGYVTAATLSDAGVLINGGALVVGGQIAYPSDGGRSAATIIDSKLLDNTGVILLEAGTGKGPGGTLSVTATGTLTNTGSIIGGGTLVNDGTMNTGSGVITLAALVNQGTISLAASDVLQLDAAVSGAGVFAIGANATLALSDPFAFTGVIDALGPQATLDFVGQDIVSAQSSNAALTLGLADGAHLHLALSPGADPTLALAADGHGGTDLLLSSR